MAILARDPVTGALTLIESPLPRDVALDLGAGFYEVLPVGGIIGNVNVLEVVFSTAPLVSGSATAGATLTVSGTATSAVAYEYQWLADNVLVPGATEATYTTDAIADLGKTFTAQMRAQDARGRWTTYASSSNSITIPAPVLAYSIPDGEWTAVEDPDDAETRQTYVTATPTVAVPAGKKLRWYKGTTNPTDSSMFVFLTNMTGTGPYIGDSVGAALVGQTIYSRIAMSNTDNTSPEWVTSIKSYVTSNVPGAPGAFTATNSTTVTGRVSLDPNNTAPATNGRAILEYGYSQNGGAPVAFATGGTATTARDVDFVGTAEIAVRLHARNVNGWSLGSAAQTVTPPVITGATNTAVPSLETNLWPGGSYTINAGDWTGAAEFTYDLEVSDNGTSGWTTLSADVQLTGIMPAGAASKYIRVKETPSVGTAAYSLASAQFNVAKDHVLSSLTAGSYAKQSVTPFLGLSAIGSAGLWFSACFYYNGTDTLDVNSALISLGADGASPTRQIWISGLGIRAVDNSSTPTAQLSAPTVPGWYLVTGRVRRPSTTIFGKYWRNDEVSTEGSSTSGAYSLTGANFGTLRLLKANSAAGVEFNGLAHSFCWGTGDPTLAHAWAYNGGDIRQMKNYDFGTDPNGATIDGHVDPSRVGSATFSAGDLVDTVGTYDTWTAFGSLAYKQRKPGYVFPGGDPAPVPSAYIGPGGHGFSGETFTLQTGYYNRSAMTATAWVTSTSYAVDARVTQGGNLYVCTVAHTAGTFATDLAAEKWKIYTLNTLTHAAFPADHPFYNAAATSLGDIKPLVSNGSFTVAQPGIVTANITVGSVITAPAAWAASTSYTAGDKRQTGGKYYRCITTHTSSLLFSDDLAAGLWLVIYETLNVEAHVFTPRAMPAAPRLATIFRNNGLAAGIEPYPTVTGTGETFANTAALQTRINALAAGETLIVENLNNFDTGVALTITGRDFGGATVVARNLGGVRIDSIIFAGTTAATAGLTLRGLEVKNSIDFDTLGKKIRSIWIDHFRAYRIKLDASDPTASWVRVTNFAVWPDTPNGQCGFGSFKIVALGSCIFGGTPTDGADVLRVDRCNQFITDRVVLVDSGATGLDSHPDLLQMYLSGYRGYISGMIRRTIAVDGTDSGRPPQGLFLSGGAQRLQDFRMEDCLAIVGATNVITLSGPQSNCYIKNTFGNSGFAASPLAPAAVFFENCIKGGTGLFTTFPGGTEFGNLRLGSLTPPRTLGDVYPAYATAPAGSWQQIVSPNVGYDTYGPATFIAELEAKRVALGI